MNISTLRSCPLWKNSSIPLKGLILLRIGSVEFLYIGVLNYSTTFDDNVIKSCSESSIQLRIELFTPSNFALCGRGLWRRKLILNVGFDKLSQQMVFDKLSQQMVKM
ncbi:MAG: hypothetical protein K9G34_03950 [Melioribacteraceae bacterium]|nr:hypothetical protein [Melioribacteraceae bacterium]